MALRFKSASANIAVAGTTIAHGLTANGSAVTPDEVWVLPTTAAGAGQTYRYAANDSTAVYLAQGTSACSADVYAAYNHSTIR